MRGLVIVLVIVAVVLCLLIAALTIGGDVADKHAAETQQMATEWQRDVVEPIQTERAAQRK